MSPSSRSSASTSRSTIKSLLVANRGEIAIRVMRAAAELGIRTVAIYSEDDDRSLHIRKADEARPLRGHGVAAYLDGDQIVALAVDSGCDAVHPGYGFLSENPLFAELCARSGVTFVGPRAETLELCGDKSAARKLAMHCDIPVPPGTSGPTSLEEARGFLDSLGDGAAVMIKAISGGGGRGMRAVHRPDDLEAAYTRCRSESEAAFGNGDVYVERLVRPARHIEVQIIGDGDGGVSHLWERECTIQRRHQKLIEIAPSPDLAYPLRDRITAAAVRLAEEVGYRSLGTVEFLLDASRADTGTDVFFFNEVNPRLQVEHTVTEEVTGIDLVKAQLRLASGRSLADLDLLQPEVPPPRGFALELRINMETMTPEGEVRPSGGTLTRFEPPSGAGVRVDTYGYTGYSTNPRFDSLLAKLICSSSSAEFADVVSRASRALGEFRIEGVPTNIGFLGRLLGHPDVASHRVDTGFVDRHITELVPAESGPVPRRADRTAGGADQTGTPALAGAKVDTVDPLAVLNHGKTQADTPDPWNEPEPPAPATVHFAPAAEGPSGTVAVRAEMQGTIVSIDVREGDLVHAGQQVLVMEAMKMEHVVASATGGLVVEIAVSAGDAVYEGHPLLFIEEADVDALEDGEAGEIDLDFIRPDLAEVHDRHAVGLDAARPEAVAKRRERGFRTARENVDDLCDPDSFVEYAPMVVAAQRLRRSEEDLIRNTPADGMVTGIGRINGDLFDDARSRCIVMSYDYTVLAGTQGALNHYKKDRMFELAERWRLPLVLLAEGGGGRPGDTDGIGVSGLNVYAFTYFAQLSGLVPLVGITNGRCFAGNAVLLGCCDVIIATEGSNIGVGGPAMIEGGGLGVFRPEEVGPLSVQVPNGVVDVVVADEAEAVQVAKRYLSYFQGPVDDWECADQRLLRNLVPENRLRIYDIRKVIETLADTGSVLELRRNWGHGIVTALARIEGRPVGVVANNPAHLAGAIDSPGADKGARFMQLCDAFDIPILYLCDCPGIMVGPEIEKTALVRHSARMFVVGANVTVPFFSIVLRKAYGLGALAMVGGSSRAPIFTISWPTGEFGGMGLEGAVKLGYRKELAAIEDPVERKEKYEEMVAHAYDRGKAVSAASYFEFDDVIDPLESRRWIVSALRSVPEPEPRTGKKRPCVDTW